MCILMNLGHAQMVVPHAGYNLTINESLGCEIRCAACDAGAAPDTGDGAADCQQSAVHLPPASRSSGDGRKVPQSARSFRDIGMRTLPTMRHEDPRDAEDEVVLRIEVAGDRSVRVSRIPALMLQQCASLKLQTRHLHNGGSWFHAVGCQPKVGVACAKIVGFVGASLLLLLMVFKFIKVCAMSAVYV